MADVLTPRPASTILPLRNGRDGVEVLLVRRNLNSDFVGGAYVFPGGAVDPSDQEIAVLCRGRDDASASTRLALATGGLAYYVAALRELFEEAGLLVAQARHAESPALTDRVELARWRDELNAGRCRLADVLEGTSLVLDLAGVEYLAHWVTPIGPPRRYDTRFFVAEAPLGQVAGHDDAETVAHRWMRPADALAAASRGEIAMILPTLRNLELIAPFGSVADVLEWARSRDSIARVEPRIVERGGQSAILLPGDDGYESAAPA